MARIETHRRELGWASAFAASAGLVAGFVLVFVFVPDRIAQTLERSGASPRVRDLGLLMWVGTGFAVVPAVLGQWLRGRWRR